MLKKFCVKFLLLLFLSAPLLAYSATESDLKEQIDAKSRELEIISQQIQQTQGTLSETTAKGKTLKQEVDKIDKGIQSVALGIKKSEILVSKLGLEVQSLGDSIKESEQSLADKKEAITGLIQALQTQDDQGLLLTFLNNKSLSDSLLEAQALSDLNGELLTQLASVRELKAQLIEQQEQVKNKKSSTEAEKSNLQIKKSIAEDQKAERAQLLAQTKDQERLYQQQLSELEKRQQAISDEIDRIESDLRSSYNAEQLPGIRAGVFAYPIPNAPITQNYGATTFAQRAYKTRFHNGLDFGGSIGTPIFAAADGTVTIAGNNGKLQYGKYVLLKHANNLSTIYGHMSRQAVLSGQVVKKGDIIGYVGNTGYATGPHLHFGVYLSATIQLKTIAGAGIVPVGYTLNPADYL